MSTSNHHIDKQDTAKLPKIKRMTSDIAGMKKGDIILVPSLRQIEDFICGILPGKHVSIQEMRRQLAHQQGAEKTCPIYTGYHLRAITEAMLEWHRKGRPLKKTIPVWRVLDTKSPTVKKIGKENAAILARQRVREKLPH